MALVRIDWKPGPKKLRQFGVSLLIGFPVISLILRFVMHKPETSLIVLAVGAAMGLIGLSGTRLALPVYWAWMGIAFVMGNIMSRVLLALFYYGLITPMGLVMRLSGRDKLFLRRNRGAPTYWVDLQKMPGSDHERQF